MAERVQLMSCADGIARADNGSFGKGPLAKTANFTIGAAQTGTTFTNKGASGAVTFTLPKPKAGFWFMFLKVAAQNILLKAPTGSKVGAADAGKILQNVTNGDAASGMVRLYCDGTDYWNVGSIGTWAANNA